MSVQTSAPWHRESFDRFLNERLPDLLAARLPLAGYQVEDTEGDTCRVRVSVATQGALGTAVPVGEVEVTYAGVPRPDAEGIFWLGGKPRVVVPTASGEALDTAEIRCAGEQLLALFTGRLGEAPRDLPWEPSLLRAWLPLDAWVQEFLRGTGQPLDTTNALSRITHLRRLLIPGRRQAITVSQIGRTCPFETPEGPNLGAVLSVAVGARIRDGRLVITEDRPEAALGASASMVPFLEHSDPVRLLMGVNMMRQWMVPPDPEPALVQTGNEPDLPRFWCGRNLLTAFLSWGIDTFEDGLAISESCARRLGYPHAIEPGDKLSNRHGTKGVISRILPDDEMPHLADGTPVELIFSLSGLHTRLNFGQIREALMGRLAHAEGVPTVVPPFHAPNAEELHRRLAEVGLAQDGMEVLSRGRGGDKLAAPSMVGWVYWGRLAHVAQQKLHTAVTPERAQRSGELEYYALRDAGALANLREQFNTRAGERPDAATLPARAASGPVAQAGPPTPTFAELARRLAAAGIRAVQGEEGLRLSFAAPEGETLPLARPVPHPWLRERELVELGALPWMPQYRALVQTNERARRMLAGQVPGGLAARALADLDARVAELFETLLTPSHLRLGARTLFSGRAVAAPGAGLRFEQVGLAEEIAWTLFGPLVTRELGGEEEVRGRTERAAAVLDAVMARSWVLINRAPSLTPTAFIAFHPVRRPERVIRLHPLACAFLNADFDGDQVAVFLPVTEDGQREAGERLTLAGHLARDPALLPLLLPPQDAFWGLAWLSLTGEGRAELRELASTELAFPEGWLTKAALLEAMAGVLTRTDAVTTLERLERLTWRGFEVAGASGASLSPFAGEGIRRPPRPATDDPRAWEMWAEQLAEQIASRADFTNPDLGPQLLAVKSGARGRMRMLNLLLGARGVVTNAAGNLVPVPHGLVEGLSPVEMLACAAGARRALGEMLEQMARQMPLGARSAHPPQGFHVLARAMRAAHPGVVFARAAATGEVDPLTDPDSRLFVGL